MKKLFCVCGKFIAFFLLWAVIVSFLPIPDAENPAIWRFWAELTPLFSTVLMTLVFWLLEKRTVPLQLVERPVRGILLGLISGILWLGLAVGIMFLVGVLRLEGTNQISMLWLWLCSAFLNTIMQELLIRGYLYQMIQKNYSAIAAAIVTTVLFTLLHGGAFEAGILPVLNVATMSLFMSVLLDYTGSLIAPIGAHFLWNGIGAIILGGVSLAEDYPHLLNMTFHGNTLLTGGNCKMEGSIIVLILNVLFTVGFLIAKKKSNK